MITLIYLTAFALSSVMLLGERGRTYDLRSRRRVIVRGGRREFDPGAARVATQS